MDAQTLLNCKGDTQVGRNVLIPAEAIAGWNYLEGMTTVSSAVQVLQLTGAYDSSGPAELVFQATAAEDWGGSHLVARIEFNHGAARFRALVDVAPGQGVDCFGASAVVASVGWVAQAPDPVDPDLEAFIQAACILRPRTTGLVTLSTPSLPEGDSVLLVPPFARYLRVAGTIGNWAAGATVIGPTAGNVPSGADRVTVSLEVAAPAVWELAL